MATLSTCQSQSCEKIESCERVSEQNWNIAWIKHLKLAAELQRRLLISATIVVWLSWSSILICWVRDFSLKKIFLMLNCVRCDDFFPRVIFFFLINFSLLFRGESREISCGDNKSCNSMVLKFNLNLDKWTVYWLIVWCELQWSSVHFPSCVRAWTLSEDYRSRFDYSKCCAVDDRYTRISTNLLHIYRQESGFSALFFCDNKLFVCRNSQKNSKKLHTRTRRVRERAKERQPRGRDKKSASLIKSVGLGERFELNVCVHRTSSIVKLHITSPIDGQHAVVGLEVFAQGDVCSFRWVCENVLSSVWWYRITPPTSRAVSADVHERNVH